MEKIISELKNLFGQNGWRNEREEGKIIFSKKQEKIEETKVVVFINKVSFHIIYSDNKYEVEKENFDQLLHFAEEIYKQKRQVLEWVKRRKKKNFSIIK